MPMGDWEGAEQVWWTSFGEQGSGINAYSSKMPGGWLALSSCALAAWGGAML